MTDATALIQTIDRAGYRLTEPRRAIAGLISERAGHFTAADLVGDARLNRLDIGRATIFRALDLFAELGAVERLDLPSGEHAYVRCEPSHHHHLVCSGCGRSRDVDDPAIDAITRSIARRTGYRIDSHRLELFGLCPACRAAARPDRETQ